MADGRSRRRDRARYADEAAHRRAYARSHAQELRDSVVAHYADCCRRCGSEERLELHHANGNGELHRDRVGHGDAFFRWLVRMGFPPECEPGGKFELQVLCRRCHIEETRQERLARQLAGRG